MSVMDVLFATADMKCTICGKSQSVGCSCWKKCNIPGCKWSYRNIKGQKCRNPDHPHNKRKLPRQKDGAGE